LRGGAPWSPSLDSLDPRFAFFLAPSRTAIPLAVRPAIERDGIINPPTSGVR
jgi:hypothetical protein